MKLKIGFMILFISISFSILYGLDKITSENPSDSALIRIGLSDIDSSTCEICDYDGIYYESGCKRCIQDGVVLTAHVSNERFYNVGWSNNNGMYYGDEKCDGTMNFENLSTNVNDTYFISISKTNLNLETNFYHDKKFSNLKESISTQMCSNPTNLEYIRISNEDGKPPGNGGKLSGSIDEIEIFKKNNNEKQLIFSSSFNECLDKTCNGLWNFRNTEKIFINTETDSLSFFSEVLGTNDYAHLKLNEKLPDSWEMRFKLEINELEEHPRGKGFLKIEPELRQIIFGIPALFLPFIGFGITQKSKSKSFGITIIFAGMIILIGSLLSQNLTTTEISNIYQFTVIILLSILIIILGMLKTGIRLKNRYEINN